MSDRYYTVSLRGYWIFLLFSLLASCGGGSAVREQGAVTPHSTDMEAVRPAGSLRPPLTLRWRVKLKGPLLSTPVVRESMMYIPMSDNKIYRMDARDGTYTRLGSFKGTAPVAPALDGDILFLSFTGQSRQDLRQLLAYDFRKEKILWRKDFMNGWSAPVFKDRVLYIGAEDAGIYAIDTKTGETRWKFMAQRQVRSSPVVTDGMIIAGSDDNTIYALDAGTGTLRWSYRTGGSIMGTPVVADGSVYVASYDRNLYCLDALSGMLRWRFTTNGSLYGMPAVQGNRVFLGSNDRNLYCLDAATGTLLWRYETKGTLRASPVPMNSVVYMGSTDRRLHAVDVTTGQQVWQYETDGSITVTPVVVGDMLVVGSEDRYVYAFSAADAR